MSLKTRHQDATRRLLPRAVAVALTLGGLTSIVVADSAGALPSRGKSLVISTTANPRYGTILVSRTTVYTLKTASKVACGPKCLRVWPQVLLPKGVKRARAGKGTDATKLGTVKRKDGALQVTYAGKALYWFYEDNGPGQVNGNVRDKWGTWAVVVTATPASAVLQPAVGTTTVPTTSPTTKTSPTSGMAPTSQMAPTSGKTGVTMLGSGTAPMAGTMPTDPPTTTPTPPPTTVPTTTPTTSPATTTTTTPGGGGVGF